MYNIYLNLSIHAAVIIIQHSIRVMIHLQHCIVISLSTHWSTVNILFQINVMYKDGSDYIVVCRVIFFPCYFCPSSFGNGYPRPRLEFAQTMLGLNKDNLRQYYSPSLILARWQRGRKGKNKTRQIYPCLHHYFLC